MPISTEIGLVPGHVVLDRDPAPHPKKRAHPQFLAHVSCGEMAGLIKMPLGTEVGLGPGNIVLDRDSSPKGGKGKERKGRVFI